MVLRSLMQPVICVVSGTVLLTSIFGQASSVEMPVTLTGSVEIASGEPLTGPATVRLSCARSGGHTVSGELSAEGRPETGGLPMASEVLSSIEGEFIFHFYIRQVAQSRSQAVNQPVNLTGCSLSARLPGFQSTTIHLGMRHRGGNADVGTILLNRLEEGGRRRTVNLTGLKVPSRAREEYRKARDEMRKDEPNYSKATKHLEKALEIYPEYANAWSQVGRVREALGDESGARKAYEKAISLDPEYLRPYLGLCRYELEADNWQKLSELSHYVLERNPTIVVAQYYQSLAQFSLGDLEAAEKWAMAVRESSLDSTFPTTHFLLGAIWAHRGDIPKAAEQFELYLQLRSDTGMAAQASRQLESWQKQGLLTNP